MPTLDFLHFGSKVKILKIILVLFVASLIFFGCIALLLFTPWFPKTLILTALEDTVEGTLDVEEVHLLPGSLEFKNLSYSDKDWEVIVGEAKLEFSLHEVWREKEVKISMVKVSGLEVDLSRILEEHEKGNIELPPGISGGGESSSSDQKIVGKEISFPGILRYTDSGYGLWVDHLSVEGKVLLPASREMEFIVSGKEIIPGASATLQMEGSLVDQTPDAPVSGVKFDGEATFTQSNESGLSDLRIVTTAYARGAAFDGEIALRKEVSVKRDDFGGESLQLHVAVINSLGEREALFDLNNDYVAKNSEFRGRFSLNTSSAQLRPFAAGIPLPDFSSNGSGTYDYSLVNRSGSLKSSIDAQLNSLQAISPELRDVPPLGIHAEIDIDHQESGYRVNKLRANIDDLNARKRVLDLASSSPFQVNPRADDLGFKQAQGNLLTLEIDRLPVDWFAQLPSKEAVTGGLLSGKFAVAKENGFLKARITEPLKVDGVSYNREGREYFEDIDIILEGYFGYSAEELSFNLNSLEMRSGSSLLVEGTLDGSVELTSNRPGMLKAGGKLTTQLKELYRQPFASQLGGMPASPLSLEQSFQFVLGKESLKIANFNWNLRTEEGEVYLQGETLQPISFPIPVEGDWQLSVEQSGDLARLEFSDLPVELLAPYILDYQLSGKTVSGELILSSDRKKFDLKTESALLVGGIDLSRNGEALLDDLSISVIPTIAFGGDELVLSWKDLLIRSGRKSALSGDGELSFDISDEPIFGKASGEVQADIGYLARQPLFARYLSADSGLLAFSGTIDLQDRQSVSGQLLIKDLHSTKAPENTIERGEFSFEGKMEDGSFQLQAPITLQGSGGNSDLLLTILFEPQDAGARFQISAEGKSLVIADVLSLTDFLEKKEEISKPDEAPKPLVVSSRKRDLKPFWTGYTGEASLDIGQVIYPGIGELDEFNAVFRASPNQLFIESKNSGSAGNPLDLKGEINFNSGKIKPYSLVAQLGIANFDIGSFLRRGNPQERPLVEGIFDLTGAMSGEAENPEILLDTAQGEFYLQSRSEGIFRALPRGQKGQAASVLLGGLDLLAGDKVRQINTANRAANLLREIKFEEMKIKAVRGNDLNFNMTDLLVRGPQIIMAGEGSVTYRKGIPFLDQPLSVKAQIAAKEEAAYLLNELGHLKDQQTEDGYYLGPSFAIKGSLGNPDKSELDRILKSSTLGFFGVGGGRKVDLEKSNETGDSAQSETNPEPEPVPDSDKLNPVKKPTREEELLKSIFQILKDG